MTAYISDYMRYQALLTSVMTSPPSIQWVRLFDWVYDNESRRTQAWEAAYQQLTHSIGLLQNDRYLLHTKYTSIYCKMTGICGTQSSIYFVYMSLT